MVSLKILACGSVDGQYEKFVKKISSIQKKNGPFEMVISSGDFFSCSGDLKSKWKSFCAKRKSVDVPVYLLGPTTVDLVDFYSKDILEDGGEVYPNILYLGSKGVFKTSSGLTIAYLSGSAKKEIGCNFTKKDIDSLINQVKRDEGFHGVDILLTSSWPYSVTKHTKSQIKSDDESQLISVLALALKPRYHISCHKEKFYERPPYRNHQVLRGGMQHVSRFLSLAPFNNSSNEKGFYAFSITPLVHSSREELIKQPDDVTECPFLESSNPTTQTTTNSVSQNQFFFSQETHKRKGDKPDHKREHKTPKGPPTLSSACWFCLGSKEVEKHLVISVGEKCYVALAKGALNVDHVLICPTMHFNSTVVCPDDVVMEMEKYKECLRKMFATEDKHMVSFERNFYTQHLQLQIVGVPSEMADELKDSFMDFGELNEMQMIELNEDQDISELVAVTTPYFMVETAPGQRLLHKVKGKMPLQFGREVLCSAGILNQPDRVDWKKCRVEKEEEIKQTKEFRERFKKYDFNFM